MIDFQSQYIPEVYESARLNDNLDGTGGITVSWNSASYVQLPIGTSVIYNGTKYSLLEPYSPNKASAIPHYRYEVTFQHPLARLSRVPFYINSQYIETDNNGVVQHVGIQLHTVPYTGLASTIANKLASFFTEYGQVDSEFASTFGTWTCDMPASFATTVITVEFDGCSIRAAATRIADACGCNVFFDWSTKTIRFIVGSTIDGESYNCFRVLGGTTNMAKRNVSGMYAPVTQRLTLQDTQAYPNSIIDRSGENGIRLTTDLIFDDIYPKMELFIKSVRERRCYLTDDDGKQIPDGNGGYKQYSKWYVTLKYSDDTTYTHDISSQIADKPLALLFQPTYGSEETSPLAGRQFEVVYFAQDTEEWEEDDVLPESDKFEAKAGEFRIIFATEGDAILPTTYEDKLIPKIGNKVTLVNVAVDSIVGEGGKTYKQIAQDELLATANTTIAAMMADSGEYSAEIIGNIPTIGSEYTIDGHTGIVTTVNADLDTGVATVTIGSWKRKTLTGGIRDKIDSITTKTTEGTTEGEKGLTKSQFDALWKTTKKPSIDTTIIDTMGANIEEIKRQSDAKFDIIFGYGAPSVTHPEADWTTTELKNEHVQDIYYDTSKPGANFGGRAWRWMFHAAGSSVTTASGTQTFSEDTWQWEVITDMDTMASLERIAFIENDGVITAGAEKSRLFIEWKNAADQFNSVLTQAANAGLDSTNTAYSNLVAKYWYLWRVLNNTTPYYGGQPSGKRYNDIPLWLSADLWDSDIKFSDYDVDPDDYRGYWNDFYAALAELNKVVTGEAFVRISTKVSFFVSATVPTPPYDEDDMWLKLHSANDTTGDLYRCIQAKTSGDGDEDNWVLMSSYGVSLTDILGRITAFLEDYVNTTTQSGASSILVCMGQTDQRSGSRGVWFDTSGTTARLEVGSNTSSDTELKELFLELYSILGVHELTIYNGKYIAGFPSPVNMFDIYMKRSTFFDKFTQSDIDGSLGVWVRGENSWIKVLDDTTGVIQNYGDHIVLAIFGNDALPSGQTSYAAGLTTGKNFSTMFAQAVDKTEEGETTALAAISTIIARDPVTHKPTGKILLTADQVQIDASDLDLRAEDITFSSGGTLLNLQENLVTLLIDNLGYQTTGAADTQALQQQLGMVIRKNGSGSGEFSFGTFVNGTFVAGINFVTENSKTKLNLTADNAKIAADLVSVIASQVSVNASNINFISQTIDMSGATSINLNAGTINLNAEKITWKGHDIIPGGSGSSYNPATESYFYVSNLGDVTMNSATIRGAITANTGYIGGTNGWVIESQHLYSGTIGNDASMHLATANQSGTIAGQNLSTWRFTVGSKFGVTSDGKLFADGATITNINASGSITLPSDTGTFTYSKDNQFGLYMNSSQVFTTTRNDYIKQSTERGAILRIEQINQSSSFRGLFCDGEVEIIGITQLLRTPNADFTVDALIVEGIDNKRAIKTVGVVNSGRNVRHTVSVDASTYSVTVYDDIIFLSSSSKQTVTFPSDPETGREIWIRNIQGTAEINFNGKSATGNSPDTISNTDKWHIYIYRGGVWFYGYTN